MSGDVFTGKDLDALVKRRKISINELAAAIGVHRNTLNRYIAKNEDVPRTVRLALAAWIYDLPPIMRAPRSSSK